jgi:hypothetical protein
MTAAPLWHRALMAGIDKTQELNTALRIQRRRPVMATIMHRWLLRMAMRSIALLKRCARIPELLLHSAKNRV